MSKAISPGGIFDPFIEGPANTKTIELNLAEYNPESKNAEVDVEEQLRLNEEKIAAEHLEVMLVIGKDGYVMAAAQGDGYSCGVTDRALENYEGAIVTHNHPQGKYGGYSGTLSIADIKQLLRGPKEMRAVAAEGVYSMKVDKNSDVQGFLENMEKHKSQIRKELREIHDRCEAKAESGGYKGYREYYADNASQQLEYLHRFYQKYAADYGIDYSFHKDANASETMKQRDKNSPRNILPPKAKTGAGSRTKVLGKYREKGTGRTLVHYQTNGKSYVVSSSGKRYSGDEAQQKLNSSTRTGTMGTEKFVKWKRKNKIKR